MTVRTREVQYEFLRDMVELQLYFVALKKNREPQLSMTKLVNEYCIIMNFTDFNENSMFDVVKCSEVDKWKTVVDAFDGVYTQGIDPEHFVTEALTILNPYLCKRVEADLENLDWLYCNESRREATSLFYNVNSEDEYMYFHVENSFYPESFLSYPELFKKHLLMMVLDAEKAGKKGIEGTTWLNYFTPWLKLFPKEWRLSDLPDCEYLDTHLGLWGQFISPDFTVNKSVVRKFKKMQDFPYQMRTCRATIDEFKNFLIEESTGVKN